MSHILTEVPGRITHYGSGSLNVNATQGVTVNFSIDRLCQVNIGAMANICVVCAVALRRC